MLRISLVSDGPTEFMREYGTHYVAGLQKGLQYSVILTYESDDAEQVRQILAKFGSEVHVPVYANAYMQGPSKLAR